MQISIGDTATSLIKTPKSKQAVESWNRPRSSNELRSFIEERFSFLPEDLELI